MIIEVLFSELGYLHGDIGNVKYLKACLPEARFIETGLEEEPAFVREDVDLIYMGGLSEENQRKAIEKLMPYKERIEELINQKVCMLFTGNAMEVFFREIIKGENVWNGLNIFDFSAVIRQDQAFVGNYFGQFNERKIVGCKIQQAMTYGANDYCHFAKSIRGIGINRSTGLEGIRKNNFIGTYLVGPLLVMNPYFTQYLLFHMGIKKPKLAFDKTIIEAYQQRVMEFENKKTSMQA